MILGLFSLRALLGWAGEQAAFEAATRVKVQTRDLLYRHLLSLGPVRLSLERSGELATVLTDGVEALEACYARYLPAVALMVLLPLSILVVVFPLDWIAALILLLTAPLIPLFMVLIGRGAERLKQRQWRRLAPLSAHFLDVIQGLTTLKLFNASRREVENIARISDEFRHSTMAVLRVAFLSSLALEFFATVSIAVVAVSIGFRLLWGEMDFLPAFFILLLAPSSTCRCAAWARTITRAWRRSAPPSAWCTFSGSRGRHGPRPDRARSGRRRTRHAGRSASTGSAWSSPTAPGPSAA